MLSNTYITRWVYGNSLRRHSPFDMACGTSTVTYLCTSGVGRQVIPTPAVLLASPDLKLMY